MEPIGETFDYQEIYAFEISKKGEPYAIWIKEDCDIKSFHMTRIANGDIAIEYHDQYDEYLYGEYFGNEKLFKFHHQYSKNSRRMDQQKAQEWLKELALKAYVTEESVIGDNVTGLYYLSNDLPQYIFWSEGNGCLAGPGAEDSNLEDAIANPKKELWPLFDLAGEDAISQLKDVLSNKKSRKIDAFNVMKLSKNNETYEFGWYLGKSLSSDEEYEYRDAILWLNSLSGESNPKLKQAETETIAQIELWQKSIGKVE